MSKMPTVDIDENIKQVQMNIEQLTQEVFRLQGVLNTFMNFKKGGLKTIDLPNDPDATQEVKDLESIQENPE